MIYSSAKKKTNKQGFLPRNDQGSATCPALVHRIKLHDLKKHYYLSSHLSPISQHPVEKTILHLFNTISNSCSYISIRIAMTSNSHLYIFISIYDIQLSCWSSILCMTNSLGWVALVISYFYICAFWFVCMT